MKLLDATGRVPRMVGLIGVGLLVALALMPEAREEPAPSASAEAAAPAPEMPEPPADDPMMLRESSRLRRLIPVYPGARLVPMGLMEANGNKMEMGYFQVKATAREVLDFYNKEFGTRGRRVVEQLDGTGGGLVNYYDSTLGSLVAVTAKPHVTGPEPVTLVFPSITAVPNGVLLKAEDPQNLPKPSGLVTLMRVDDHTRGPSEGSSTLTQIATGTPKELGAYYRQEMVARGYAVAESRTQEGVELIDFVKEGDRVQMTISPLNPSGTKVESVIAIVIEDATKRKESLQ